MDPVDSQDVPPIRPGAAPRLDVAAAGLRTNRTQQPGWTRLTEIILRVLRYHFGSAARIEFADLAARVYTDQPDSPLVIASLAEWKPDESNQRPAVLVDRLDQTLDEARRGIGDQLQGIRPGNYAHFMNGAHVVHCLGGREGEADLLAAEVWRDLSRFKHVIRAEACLERFLPNKLGKRVQLSAEHRAHYTVPILCPYYYQEDWRVTPTDEAVITTIRTAIRGGPAG